VPESSTLRLASHPLPTAWEGRRVEWGRWAAPVSAFICPPPRKPGRCGCGSSSSPYTARGLRHPDEDNRRRAESLPRIGRRRPLVWPLYDIHAFRCPDCGEVTVWDTATDEWWTLDESDYGPTGSWSWSGGLLDALLVPEPSGSGSES
jgi:hypothetical protein